MKNQLALIPERESAGETVELKAWALVELFGHQQMVGYLTTQAFGSAVMFRVDVPDLLKDGKVVRQGFTRYLSPGAIYAITPVTEDIVRQMLPTVSGEPGARPMQRFSREDDY